MSTVQNALLLAALVVGSIGGASGRAIYEEGAGLNAEAGGVTLRGRAAACASCHGDPHDGGGEGGVTAPPLMWSALGEASAGRGAYDPLSFAAALRAGRDPEGRSLHALMPRYRIDDADIASLLGYLARPAPMPGVHADEIVVTTIMPPAGPLRTAGEAAAQTLGQEIALVNQRGAIFGRKLRLSIVDAGRGAEAVRSALATAPPLMVIGSVGLGAEGPMADIVSRQGLLNFAPLAALTGGEDRGRVSALRPGLAAQARALAERAIKDHGCYDLDVGADARSALAGEAVASAAATSGSCSARLILHPRNEAAAVIDRARRDGAATVYLSAEQTGIVPSADRASSPSVVAAIGGFGSLEQQAAENARDAVAVLTDALSSSGSRISPKRLTDALTRSAADRDSEVRLLTPR